MRRREFIASAWPLAVRAQQSVMPTIGFLSGASSGNYQPFVTAFKEGLKQTDYVEERNVAIEYRWAEGQFDRLPKLAANLVDDRPTVIMASGNAAAVAAKRATATIPIVFTSGIDPISNIVFGPLLARQSLRQKSRSKLEEGGPARRSMTATYSFAPQRRQAAAA